MHRSRKLLVTYSHQCASKEKQKENGVLWGEGGRAGPQVPGRCLFQLRKLRSGDFPLQFHRLDHHGHSTAITSGGNVGGGTARLAQGTTIPTRRRTRIATEFASWCSDERRVGTRRLSCSGAASCSDGSGSCSCTFIVSYGATHPDACGAKDGGRPPGNRVQAFSGQGILASPRRRGCSVTWMVRNIRNWVTIG